MSTFKKTMKNISYIIMLAFVFYIVGSLFLSDGLLTEEKPFYDVHSFTERNSVAFFILRFFVISALVIYIRHRTKLKYQQGLVNDRELVCFRTNMYLVLGVVYFINETVIWLGSSNNV